MNTRLIAERGRRLERPLHRVGEQRRGRPSAGTAGKKKGREWGDKWERKCEKVGLSK